MTKIELTKKAKQLKEKMLTLRDAKASIKEVILMIQCFKNENYTPMKNTKLYNKYSGEFCEYLGLMYQENIRTN